MKSRFPFGVGGQRPKPAPPPPPTPQKKNKITKKKKEERDFSSFLSPFHDNEEKQIKRRLPDMCAVGGGGGGGWWGGGGSRGPAGWTLFLASVPRGQKRDKTIAARNRWFL